MNSDNFVIPDSSSAVVDTSVHFDVFTLFPPMFSGPLSESILKRAQEKRLMSVAIHNIRSFTTDKHHICDEPPYGGGGGMVMKPEPIFRAVETVLAQAPGWTLDAEVADLPAWSPELASPRPDATAVILLTPQGRTLNQSLVAELRDFRRLALICGRYEGVDDRVRTQLVTHEISIGDYVISGGELAAMIIIDAVTRLIPGALGYAGSAHEDSHSPGLQGLLEGPHYTRPATFRGEAVPDVLLSGHHGHVATWRHEQALLRTLAQRPDLLRDLPLTEKDRAFLHKHGWSAHAGGEEESTRSEQQISARNK